jgi:cobalamin biosynthesis Mg chelatase CobN
MSYDELLSNYASIFNLRRYDKDIPEVRENADARAEEMTMELRDTIVGKTYGKLMEIESRLLPCGLHIVGCPPSAEEAVATLVNIAGIDREVEEITALPQLLVGQRIFTPGFPPPAPPPTPSSPPPTPPLTAWLLSMALKYDELLLNFCDFSFKLWPYILAQSIGREIETIYRANDRGELAEVQLLQDITQASRVMVGDFVSNASDPSGRLVGRCRSTCEP